MSFVPMDELKPLCDQMHGEMQRVSLRDPITPLVVDGFQCRNNDCGRVYTPASGYRDRNRGRGGAKAAPKDSRCKEHRYFMYVREILDDFKLVYACPERRRCEKVEVVEMDDGSDGIWRRKEISKS